MDCKTAQSLVIPYINDQLSDEETEDFLEHIENCKECYEELEIHFTVHYALQKLDEDDKIHVIEKDDLELVAVIAAAIAAATGTSTDDFVVRSIKRRR